MNIPILMYHQIDVPPPSGTPLRGLVVSPGAFKRQMWLLKLLGYRGLSMRDLEPYLMGEKRGRVFGITFDDGYQNNLHNALPVLKRCGFTATCYAVSSLIGGTNRWDSGLVAEKPLMTESDWHAWLSNGMEIGSHTRTHADLSQVTAIQAREEIYESKRDLENRFGCDVRHFCYPYGRFAADHIHMASDAGYVTATTTRRGRAINGKDLMTLRRVLVARATHLLQFSVKILTQYEDRRG